MSAPCLRLPAAGSAPAEADSAGGMEPPAAAAGAAAAAALELALEEELALLAAAGEPPEPPPAAAARDPELLSLIRQKEKDLVLAARLGKALLERNQDMSRQYERMHKELTDKLEHLEQEKHELRRRFENREGEWEGRVSELESDVKQLQDELERQQVHLREADREKTRAVQELSEQNQRLLDQLSRASEVERQLSLQVHTLREDFREKNSSSSQHIVRLESLQAEIKMLTDRKRELEHRLSAMMEENDLLQGTVEELQDRVLILERQSHDKDLQLHQSQLELQEVRLSYRQLQGKVEELSEERSLQNFNTTSTSLLSEIEQSMEAEELEQEREQLRLQLWEAYCQVRYLCSHLRGNDSADSAVSTDSSMDESSETSSAKDVPSGSLRAALSELKRLIQNVLDGADSTSSRRSDDDTLEEQIRRTSEDSRALRELMEGERGKLRQSLEELQRLHSQVTLLSVEMTTLKEERDRLRGAAEDKETSERLLQAIRDRDEAIAKKNAVEVELAKCKIDMMSLNSQLLDAIQQKVNLSQQLEAWQDDMHRVIDQQLMDKHPKEWSQLAYSFSSGSGAKRSARPSPVFRPEQQGDEPVGAEGNRLFSFFKKN
ncbi:BICD family-like cargo adapter 1 isoform X1 [Falco biarmicus]|uniref:BICD family-like cargo adapter 1 isoform X2 n=1 Tax=Falco rusticolus TaxID=120794 RepID=UPI001886839C|nr:BICD family-like cargo adapter 1 isoform X2 [Falco rusticolus]XP_055571215.1 BICD family-like cargo adapter 1 isoform X1 [Falco cherrug]XP_055652321.1 BICD family-like cargo adapter 1 isoform X1 [Falco peregrinus]XP_056202054.1 BICD family-like cargo adapter 1 isoform X1 [Falco biarmicus]